MAANFWTSTHYKRWTSKLTDQFIQDKLTESHKEYTHQEIQHITLHFCQMIANAGSVAELRHWVIATAIIYFRRFYLSYSFCDVNPWLVSATCIYLAANVEEQPCSETRALQCIRAVCGEQYLPTEWSCTEHNNTQETDKKGTNKTLSDVATLNLCLSVLLEGLQLDLIIHHPYREMQIYLRDLHLSDATEMLQTCWAIIDDFYMTNAILTIPPHFVALAAVRIASSCLNYTNATQAWMNDLSTDHELIDKACHDLVHFYQEFPCKGKSTQQEGETIIQRLHKQTPYTIDGPDTTKLVSPQITSTT